MPFRYKRCITFAIGFIGSALFSGVETGSYMLNPAGLRRAIEEAIPLGLDSLKWTGGEPTLHPQFPQFLSLQEEFELGGLIETNGMLLSAALVKKIVAAELKEIRKSRAGRDVVTQLEDSKKVITIRWQPATHKTAPFDPIAAGNGVGTDSVIMHDPFNTPRVSEVGGGSSHAAPQVALAHEMFHAFQMMKGIDSGEMNARTGEIRAEEAAVMFENIIRTDLGMNQRNGYR